MSKLYLDIKDNTGVLQFYFIALDHDEAFSLLNILANLFQSVNFKLLLDLFKIILHIEHTRTHVLFVQLPLILQL